MGVGGGKSTTVGYWYSFAMHMGACRGPINAVRTIKVGDLVAWEGEVTTNDTIQIDKPALFGGEEKEGGIQGPLEVFMGNAGQAFSTLFKSLMGGLVPEFRGAVTFAYRGKIAANNPYPKPWEFRLARWDAGWDLDDTNPLRAAPWYSNKARVLLSDGRGGFIYAMNPAHILYECFTNRLWGRGLDPSMLVEDAFVSAANTLCDEGFGLCLKWTRQGDLDEFINTVLNHIGGIRYTDNETGQIGIRLIRADYDPADLVEFDYNTGLLAIEEDETGGGDSAFSEVIVKYVDAATGEAASTRAHSLAIMQSLGDVASTTADYSGLPTAELAQRVATRDLNQQAAFLKRFKITLDRRGWKLARGMVFKISAADRGLSSVVLRVGALEDSDLKDGRIYVTAIEDVFGLPASGYVEPELPGAWTPPDNTAVDVTASRLEEVSYRDLVRALSPADLATVEEPDGRVEVLASAPTGTSINYDIATAATGETITVRASGDWTPAETVSGSLGYYDTVLAFGAEADLSVVVPGDAILVDDERMAVLAVDNDVKTIEVARGVIDTVPDTHANGATAWFYDGATGSDLRTYADTETVEVALLTRTPSDVLAVGDATSAFITMNARQFRPYPPGDLRVNTIPFGTFEDDMEVATADVALSWTHRDRVLQSDQLVAHEDGSVGPEAGTTYTIEVYDGASLLRSTTGITGTAWTYNGTMIAADGEPTEEAWTFKVWSVRDGYPSWQQYEFTVHRRLSRSLISGSPDVLALSGNRPVVGASWSFGVEVAGVTFTGHAPMISL